MPPSPDDEEGDPTPGTVTSSGGGGLPATLPMVGVRPLSSGAIAAGVDKFLEQFPEGARGGVVVFGERKHDGEVVGRVAFVAKERDGKWTVMLEADAKKKPGEKRINYGVRVQGALYF